MWIHDCYSLASWSIQNGDYSANVGKSEVFQTCASKSTPPRTIEAWP